MMKQTALWTCLAFTVLPSRHTQAQELSPAAPSPAAPSPAAPSPARGAAPRQTPQHQTSQQPPTPDSSASIADTTPETQAPASFLMQAEGKASPTRVIRSSASDNPLPLEHVMVSIRHHQPLITRVAAELAQAEGWRLEAAGGFDPTIRGRTAGLSGGYYDLLRTDVELRQPTRLWGTQWYVGHRLGIGLDPSRRFPTYYEDQTLSQGEVRAGVVVPIWRNGPIDGRRAAVRQAEALTRAARAGMLNQSLTLQTDGASAYYRWAAAGHRLLVAQEQLRLARRRAEQLQKSFSAGAVAEFQVLDNAQMVASRRDALIEARRALEAAAIELSLYLRNRKGRPLLASLKRLPALHPVTDAQVERDRTSTGNLMQCHPRLLSLRAEVRAQQVAANLADNQVAPDADLTLQVSRDLGEDRDNVALPGTVLSAQLTMDFPLLLRESRGQRAAEVAKLRQRKAELEWAEDQVRALLQNARSRLRAAVGRVAAAGALVETSEALAAAERRRLEWGAGTLLAVNLREQFAADGAYRYIGALAEARDAHFFWSLLHTIC